MVAGDKTKARTLDELRAEIDRIDDALHDLVMRRAAITGDIASVKRSASSAPNSGTRLALRPAREAEILRRLSARHSGTMPLHTMVCLWRAIMSASLQAQTPFTLHAYAPEGDSGRNEGKVDYADLGHAYFGALTRLRVHKHVSHILHACADDSCALGIVPLPEDTYGTGPWWLHLAPAGQPGPRIVTKLPFVLSDETAISGYVIGSVEQEESGDDTTLILLEANAGVSRTRLQALCKGVGLDGVIAAMTRGEGQDATVYALAEILGYVAAEDPRLLQLRGNSDAIARAVCVGGFANLLTDGARRS